MKKIRASFSYCISLLFVVGPNIATRGDKRRKRENQGDGKFYNGHLHRGESVSFSRI